MNNNFIKVYEWSKLMVVDFFYSLKKAFLSMKAWWVLIKIIIMSFFEIIRNPSFLMFSIIALGLGTMGIWIGFFPNTLPSTEHSIDNLSVFTFCIATLGGIAADYFFEEKNISSNQNPSTYLPEELSRHGMFFLWSLSVLLAFWALKDDDGIYCSLSTTFLFWLLVNIKKPKFQKVDQSALDNLSPNLNSNGTKTNGQGVKGAGL
jgi:hypothetical protein